VIAADDATFQLHEKPGGLMMQSMEPDMKP